MQGGYNMCGIVGYIGDEQAAPILLDGLSNLEYRGYDSAGLAIFDGENINIAKTQGRLKNLSNLTKEGTTLKGSLGIGHTRWATHGVPSDTNAHPHFNADESIVVVHNGIIENYLKIKKHLESKGYEFISQTDTEVVAFLLDYYYEGNPLETIVAAASISISTVNKLPQKGLRVVKVTRLTVLLVGDASCGHLQGEK